MKSDNMPSVSTKACYAKGLVECFPFLKHSSLLLGYVSRITNTVKSCH